MSLFNYKFIRFLFVGAVNTLFGYSVYAFLLFIGLHYTLAVFISTIMGILFNFKTIGKFVFKNSNNGLIFKFFGVYAIVYIANTSLLSLFDLFKFNLFLAGAILVMPMAILSFILNKKFVFEDGKYEIN